MTTKATNGAGGRGGSTLLAAGTLSTLTMAGEPREPEVRRILAYLDRKYDDLAANVTGILGRHDLHLAFDLVFFSPIRFAFQGKMLRRGWVECLVIGDTRTGKSTVAEQMIAHYGMGTVQTGERCSHAGLVGGVDEFKVRFINWGLLPLWDRKMVVLDEVQELEPELISKLSNIRSSGRAEIVKIRQNATNARVRMLWIANPRHNMRLAQFSAGAHAIRGIIGKPEDIARFDFAMSAGSADLSDEVYHLRTADLPRVPHRWTSEKARRYARWAWERTAEDFQFAEGTEDTVIDYAEKLTRRYTQEIPLVIAAEQKTKVARLAAAAATCLGSHAPGDLKTVVVKPEHASLVYWFLERCYNKPSFRYRQISNLEQPEVQRMKGILRPLGRRWLRAILHEGRIGQPFLKELFANGDLAREMWSWMLGNDCVESFGRARRKRAALADMLRELLNEEGLPAGPAEASAIMAAIEADRNREDGGDGDTTFAYGHNRGVATPEDLGAPEHPSGDPGMDEGGA